MKMIREFFKYEAAGGILLFFSAVLAIGIKNSSFSVLYDSFLNVNLSVQIAENSLSKPLLLWINDGLMAVFFFLVSLEIKREVIEGPLAKREQLNLPVLAALGGIIVPSLIYIFFNWNNPISMRGWAIPGATDIAFALGVMLLLGSRVPEKLKVMLVAIAILDDIAAIMIIAFFYTADLSYFALGVGFLSILILAILNARGVTRVSPYIVTGIFLWVCVLKSGVHATLAGVILGFLIPLKSKRKNEPSPALSLEKGLHPWVAYGILPLFAFANSGVSFRGLSFEILMHPITLGIALGLFFGKQIGVILFTGIGALFKVCRLPIEINWFQYYGMSLLTGIGFTMSLFVGTLAFIEESQQNFVRMGVIVGSLMSGTLGFIVLKLFSTPKSK